MVVCIVIIIVAVVVVIVVARAMYAATVMLHGDVAVCSSVTWVTQTGVVTSPFTWQTFTVDRTVSIGTGVVVTRY